MSERAPYSRVYWSIRDDAKFAAILGDDHHLAAWLRLLIAADMAYPASADLPATARRSSVKALVDAGLVDLVPGGMFRIHGLDAERERRKQAATSRGTSVSHSVNGRGPDGDQTVPERVWNAGPKTRRDETRLGKHSRGHTVDRDPLLREMRAAITATYTEQEREERRRESLALQRRFEAGEIDRALYDRLVEDIGKEPDDLTRYSR